MTTEKLRRFDIADIIAFYSVDEKEWRGGLNVVVLASPALERDFR